MDGPRAGYGGRMGGDGYGHAGVGPRGGDGGMGMGVGTGMGMPRSFGRMGMGMAGAPRPNDFGPGPMSMGAGFRGAGAGMGGGMGMAGGAGGLGMGAIPAEPAFVVDREKTCPLLLRVWAKNGGHHRLEDFATRGKEPPGDIHVYTWLDANLREISDLIKEVVPDARARGSRLSFALIYPDRQGKNVMRQVGLVHSTRTAEDDHRTLKALKFQTGDFLDVAVLTGF